MLVRFGNSVPMVLASNVVIDMTKAVQYLNEIKDAVCLAFRNATREGAVAGEPMRGCRFNLVDVTFTLMLFTVVKVKSCLLPVLASTLPNFSLNPPSWNPSTLSKSMSRSCYGWYLRCPQSSPWSRIL